MELDFQYLQLCLENAEVINIDINDIEIFSISGIATTDFMTRDSDGRSVQRTLHCDRFALTIRGIADTHYDFLEGHDGNLTVFQRLRLFPDIVSVQYLDQEKKPVEPSVSLPWTGTYYEEENANQKGWVDDGGNLHILVERK